MINRDLTEKFQLSLVDYFFRARVILGITLVSHLLFFHYFQFIHVAVRPVLLIHGLELLLWVAYFFLAERRREWILPYNVGVLWLDVLGMTAALHYFGGTYSVIWAAFYLLLVSVSSVFFSKRGRIVFAGYVLAAYTVLLHLERARIIPRHNIFGVQPGVGLDMFCWTSVALLIVITATYSHNFVEILARLQGYAALGRLSTELAHEIRTPLQVIYGLLYSGEAAEELKREILGQAERIDGFVSEILALGRPGRTRAVRVRIEDVVQYAASEVVRAMPGVERDRVEVDTGPEELWVNGDIEQLVKAFSNLVRNGIDSMDGAGTLSVRIRRYGFEWLEVRVRDTGEGIDREEFEKIFEPFYTTRSGRRGVGLGLAIAKKCVEANGGRIEVESRRGEGSTFTVKLPLSGPPGER